MMDAILLKAIARMHNLNHGKKVHTSKGTLVQNMGDTFHHSAGK